MKKTFLSAKQAHKRHVFAKLTTEIDGKPVRFEMHKEGLHVRVKRSHKLRIIPFADLFTVSTGQSLLPLTPKTK